MKSNFFIFSPILFLLILSPLFYLLIIERNPSELPSTLINKKVPNFERKLLFNKKTFISNERFGKEKVIVNFFATWCKPCVDEHKYIKLFSKKDGIKIIGVNYKDNKKNTISWLKKMGNPYSDIIIDKDGSLGIDWGVYGIPETFLVDSNGIIKYRYVGPININTYEKIKLEIIEMN